MFTSNELFVLHGLLHTEAYRLRQEKPSGTVGELSSQVERLKAVAELQEKVAVLFSEATRNEQKLSNL